MRIFKIVIGFRPMRCAQFNLILHHFTIKCTFRQLIGFCVLDIHMQICVPQNIDLICGLALISNVSYYQSPTIRIIHDCFRHKSAHLILPKILFTFKAAVLLKYGLVKILSGPKFDYS